MTERQVDTQGTRFATILAPTDFSDESHKALRYAAALARKLSATLQIVHVTEIDYGTGPSKSGANPLTAETEEARALKRQLRETIGQSVPVDFHGRTGRAFDQIVRFAREIAADLIVMSSQGQSGLKRLFLGGNAERVVQHSSCPVLVVRGEPAALTANGLQTRAMLVPIDFSAPSREALLFAVRLARQLNARLVLFHTIVAPPIPGAKGYTMPTLEMPIEQLRAASEDQMREFTSDTDLTHVDYAIQTAVGYPAETICDYAKRQGLDLIIMSTHGRTGFMHVLIGSVAEHVVRYARTPVVTVPASGKAGANLERRV